MLGHRVFAHHRALVRVSSSTWVSRTLNVNNVEGSINKRFFATTKHQAIPTDPISISQLNRALFGTDSLVDKTLTNKEVLEKVEATLTKMEAHATAKINKGINIIHSEGPVDIKVTNRTLEIILDIVKLRRKYFSPYHHLSIYWNLVRAAVLRTNNELKPATEIVQTCVQDCETALDQVDSKSGDLTYVKLYLAICEEYSRILAASGKFQTAESVIERGFKLLNTLDHLELLPQRLILNRMMWSLLLRDDRNVGKAFTLQHEFLDKYKQTDFDSMSLDALKPFGLLHDFIDFKSEHAKLLICAVKMFIINSNFDQAIVALTRACKMSERCDARHIYGVSKVLAETLFYVSKVGKEEEVRGLLNEALLFGIATEHTVHQAGETLASPLMGLLEEGLRFCLPREVDKTLCSKMLHEVLRLHHNYPTRYPVPVEDLFQKVMTLCQIYRELHRPDEAIFLIQQFMPTFQKLREPSFVVTLIELQAQLVILDVFGDDALRLAQKTLTKVKRVPLSKQVQNVTKCQRAVSGLELAVEYYQKKKDKEGMVTTLHSLGVLQTLQEEYPYADRDIHRAISILLPDFQEFPDRLQINEKSIAKEELARVCDLLMLRGSLLRVMHEPLRAQQYFSHAYKLLQIPTSNSEEPVVKLNEELSRGSDIIRCLELIIDLTAATITSEKSNPAASPDRITELEKYRKSVGRLINEARSELNRLAKMLKEYEKVEAEQEKKSYEKELAEEDEGEVDELLNVDFTHEETLPRKGPAAPEDSYETAKEDDDAYSMYGRAARPRLVIEEEKLLEKIEADLRAGQDSEFEQDEVDDLGIQTHSDVFNESKRKEARRAQRYHVRKFGGFLEAIEEEAKREEIEDRKAEQKYRGDDDMGEGIGDSAVEVDNDGDDAADQNAVSGEEDEDILDEDLEDEVAEDVDEDATKKA